MRKFGVFCIVLGFLCLLSSAGWILYNRWEEKSAENAANALLQDVQEQMTRTEEPVEPAEEPVEPVEPAEEPAEEPVQKEITMQVNGYDCIGVLSIPVLDLELPVLNQWTYEKLKVAPCLYYGSYSEETFVIAAHNYEGHFKRLSQVQPGDFVFFTDVSGCEYAYEVVLLETLSSDATEAMITADFDLSLYTCTPGGGSRITVRCNAANP